MKLLNALSVGLTNLVWNPIESVCPYLGDPNASYYDLRIIQNVFENMCLKTFGCVYELPTYESITGIDHDTN